MAGAEGGVAAIGGSSLAAGGREAESVKDRLGIKFSTATKSLMLVAAVVVFGLKPVERLIATTSAEAVTNAPITTIRAPIDGVLREIAGGLKAGTLVDARGSILSISNARTDRQHLDNLNRTARELRTQYAAAEARLELLENAKLALYEQKERFRAGRVRQLEQRVAEVDRDIDGATANHIAAVEALSRATELRRSGFTSVANFERAVRDERVAQEALNGLVERRKGMLVELQAAREGSFVGDSYNDTPQSAQRILEVELEAADLEARQSAIERHLEEIQADILAEEQKMQARSSAVLESRIKGRVWEVMAADGEHVNAGQDLIRVIECGSTTVTASVSETAYQRLWVGQSATFKPRGDRTEYTGRVVGMNGFSAVKLSLAIPKTALTREPYHVVLDFPGLSALNSCDVGRMGLVTFDTDSIEKPVAPTPTAALSEPWSLQ